MTEKEALGAMSSAIRDALDAMGVELTWEQTDEAAKAALEALPHEYVPGSQVQDREGETHWFVGSGTIAPGYVAKYLSEGGEVLRRKVGPWETVTAENAPLGREQ